MSGNKLRNTIISIILLFVLIFSVLSTGFVEYNTKSAYDEQALNIAKDEKLTMDYLLTGGNGTVIRIATWYKDDYIENLRSFLTTSFPNIKFEFVYINKNHYEGVIDSQLSYKGAPDIVLVNASMTKKHARNRYICPLTGIEWNFDNSAKKVFYYGDMAYAIPNTSCYECIYYNKNKFEKNGLSLPDTFEKFISMCDFIRLAKKEKPLSAGLKDYDALSDSAVAILQATYFITDQGKNFGDRIQYKKSSFYNDLYPYMQEWEKLLTHEILTKEMYLMDKEAAIAEFTNEESYMCIAGPEDYNVIIKKNPNIRLGTMPLCGMSENEQVLIGGCDCGFAVNANGMNIDTAKEIVASLATKKGQIALWKDRVGSQSYYEGLDLDNPEVFDGISDAIENNRMYKPQNSWGSNSGEINIIFGTNLQEVLRGEKPLYMALMQTDIQVDRLKTDN